MGANLYTPDLARIMRVIDETPDVKTFAMDWVDGQAKHEFRPLPGQFVEVSVVGVGEVPIGISSAYDRDGEFDITVRSVGTVTRRLHRTGPGDILGIRGPLGNCFPYELARGRTPLFVAGGIGLPPLRSLIHYMLARPQEFPRLTILYGARTPSDMVYKEELETWRANRAVDLHVTVEPATS